VTRRTRLSFGFSGLRVACRRDRLHARQQQQRGNE